MSIDDKVSAKRWRFFFSVFSRYWSETHSSVKKVKSVLKPIPQLKYSKHKFEKNRSTVYFQFFLWTLFSNAHFSEYIETACRCSLRIHSRAKWYRFFGNFHLKRELMYEILSSSLSYCSLSLSHLSHFPANSFASNSQPNDPSSFSLSLSVWEETKITRSRAVSPIVSFVFHTFAEFKFFPIAEYGGIFHLQFSIEHSKTFSLIWQTKIGHLNTSVWLMNHGNLNIWNMTDQNANRSQ